MLDTCVDAGIEGGGVPLDALFQTMEDLVPFWKEASYYLATRSEGHHRTMSRNISPVAEARILRSLFPETAERKRKKGKRKSQGVNIF